MSSLGFLEHLGRCARLESCIFGKVKQEDPKTGGWGKRRRGSGKKMRRKENPIETERRSHG
jgi:hypothetical protein